jgi:DNA-binding PadR family transcriptional regulator
MRTKNPIRKENQENHAINDDRFGLWELAVLTLLRESPMHPYQMQKLLRERHKDELLALKRGSLYHAIHRLQRGALIEISHTAREGKRPERTTYSITPSGKKEMVRWLQEMISTPKTEASDLMAALSFLPYLTVDVAIIRLQERSRALEAEIAAINERIEKVSSWVARINLIETEYLCAMREAELQWVRGLERELRSGKLTWDLQELLKQARTTPAPAKAASKPAARAKKTKMEAGQ